MPSFQMGLMYDYGKERGIMRLLESYDQIN